MVVAWVLRALLELLRTASGFGYEGDRGGAIRRGVGEGCRGAAPLHGYACLADDLVSIFLLAQIVRFTVAHRFGHQVFLQRRLPSQALSMADIALTALHVLFRLV